MVGGKEHVMTETELQQLDRLQARLDALESRQAIEDLHRRFTRAVADRRFDELAGSFCEEAEIDMRRHGPMAGRDAIAKHFAGMAAVPLSGAGYVLSSPVIAVEGDEASGTWTWHRLHASGTWEEGRYRCRYRRTDDGWRFAAMHFRVVAPDPDDTREETR
jgi:uncharacterized protein (TIGR02246 family)